MIVIDILKVCIYVYVFMLYTHEICTHRYHYVTPTSLFLKIKKGENGKKKNLPAQITTTGILKVKLKYM